MATPTFSIVIPSFNRAHLLPRAIASVQAQTYQSYEIIVIDDCSTDGTEKILDSTEYKDVRYIAHEQNFGAAQARNTGINAAQGLYVCFLDSDDMWLPNKLETQKNIIENKGAEVIGCQSIKLDEVNQEVKPQFHPLKIKTGSAALLSNLHINTSGLCIKRVLLDAVSGFHTKLTNYEDWDLLLSLGDKIDTIVITEEMLVISYTHTTNTSAITSKLSKYENGLTMYQRHSKIYDSHPKAKQQLFYDLGCTARDAKKYSDALAILGKAWYARPLSIRGVKALTRIVQLLPHSLLR